MTTRDHGTRGPGINTVWTPERRQEAIALAKEGLSGSQIAKRLGGGVTRNSVIGQIHRHGVKDKKPKDKQTAKSEGSAVFEGPSKPRGWSWEEGA